MKTADNRRPGTRSGRRPSFRTAFRTLFRTAPVFPGPAPVTGTGTAAAPAVAPESPPTGRPGASPRRRRPLLPGRCRLRTRQAKGGLRGLRERLRTERTTPPEGEPGRNVPAPAASRKARKGTLAAAARRAAARQTAAPPAPGPDPSATRPVPGGSLPAAPPDRVPDGARDAVPVAVPAGIQAGPATGALPRRNRACGWADARGAMNGKTSPRSARPQPPHTPGDRAESR